MHTLRRLGVLLTSILLFTPAEAKNALQPFAGNGGASGTIWLVGKPGAESTRCSRNASVVGGAGLSFSLSCSGGRDFSLSCSFSSQGARVSGSCSAGIATLTGGGTVRGKVMSISMLSSFGTHAFMTITPSSLSFRSPDAKYVKSLQISSR